MAVWEGLECTGCGRFIEHNEDQVRQVTFEEVQDKLEAEAAAAPLGQFDWPMEFGYRCPSCRGVS